MNLHWYGWVGLVACSFLALANIVTLVINARRQQYEPNHVLYVGVWWTAVTAILVGGYS